jgi:hypothetical protein
MDFDKFESELAKYDEKIKWTNKRPFKELASTIKDDEKIYFLLTGILKNSGVTVIGVTETNIYIIAEPGTGMPLNATVIPLSKITSVSSKGGVFGTLLIAEGTVVYEIKSVLPAIATKAVNAIHQAQSIQLSENKQPQISQADELSKFKNLLDDGAITQEEYDKKKAQILGL